jgi:hypothetical protein
MRSNRPRTCHVCTSYTPAPPCAQCGQVITCTQCADTPGTRLHQAICFAITAPVGPLEQVVSAAVGGLGAVHQYVSARAWAAAEQLRPGLAVDAEDCVAGVIFNDFPADDETDAARTYVATTLTRIAPADAPYINDARFLWQPTREARWAAAAVYKGAPEILMAMAGVQHAAMDHARRMLALRTHHTRINYHFMRASADERDDEVVERAVATARRWFRLAVERRRAFLLGHVWHMVEDSFSPAHTRRDLVRTEARPYGRVEAIFFFGDQTDRLHSSRESWDAASGGPAAAYISVAVLALRDILLAYDDALRSAPLAPPPGMPPSAAHAEHAVAAAERFAVFLRERVFAR